MYSGEYRLIRKATASEQTIRPPAAAQFSAANSKTSKWADETRDNPHICTSRGLARSLKGAADSWFLRRAQETRGDSNRARKPWNRQKGEFSAGPEVEVCNWGAMGMACSFQMGYWHFRSHLRAQALVEVSRVVKSSWMKTIETTMATRLGRMKNTHRCIAQAPSTLPSDTHISRRVNFANQSRRRLELALSGTLSKHLDQTAGMAACPILPIAVDGHEMMTEHQDK
jgi:hypothetical protein